MPKSLLLQLVLQVGIPALLFWDKLGPFNCAPAEKYLFIEHQTQNFLIVMVICVNSFQFSFLMCVVFLLISYVSFMGQCENPFPGIEDFI